MRRPSLTEEQILEDIERHVGTAFRPLLDREEGKEHSLVPGSPLHPDPKGSSFCLLDHLPGVPMDGACHLDRFTELIERMVQLEASQPSLAELQQLLDTLREKLSSSAIQ